MKGEFPQVIAVLEKDILKVLEVLTALIKSIEKRSCHMKVINAMQVELLRATQTF